MMNDKDKQQLDALQAQLTAMQIKCHQQTHELMTLHQHLVAQDKKMAQLLAMLGLVPADLNVPAELMAMTAMLRLRRAEN